MRPVDRQKRRESSQAARGDRAHTVPPTAAIPKLLCARVRDRRHSPGPQLGPRCHRRAGVRVVRAGVQQTAQPATTRFANEPIERRVIEAKFGRTDRDGQAVAPMPLLGARRGQERKIQFLPGDLYAPFEAFERYNPPALPQKLEQNDARRRLTSAGLQQQAVGNRPAHRM